MKRRIWICLLAALLAVSLGIHPSSHEEKAASAAPPQLTAAQRTADFDYMVKILKENYPYFGVNERVNHVDWLALQPGYHEQAATAKTDAAFAAVLAEDLNQLHNGHTGLLSAAEVAYDRSVYSRDTHHAPWLAQLNRPAVARRYGSATAVSSAAVSAAQGNAASAGTANMATLENGRAVYLGIRSFDTFHIAGDMAEIEPFLQQHKDASVLILDIRGNGGGDTRYWTDHLVPLLAARPLTGRFYSAYRGGAFVGSFLAAVQPGGYTACLPASSLKEQGLANLPPEVLTDFQYASPETFTLSPQNTVGFHGRIYLLVDGRVFSSSEAFAAFAKATGFATLVGTRTGGDGIGFDPAVCALPHSGYVFRFPEEMGLNPDGSSNFETDTVPDIPASGDSSVPSAIYFNAAALAADPAVKAALADAG